MYLCIHKMQAIKGHIKILGRLFLLWFILFSLAPCGAKGNWLDTLDLEYSRSLNKSRTTPVNSCQFIVSQSRTKLIVKEAQLPGRDHSPFLESMGYPAPAQPKLNWASAGGDQGPPKYILFKRLKIAALPGVV